MENGKTGLVQSVPTQKLLPASTPLLDAPRGPWKESINIFLSANTPTNLNGDAEHRGDLAEIVNSPPPAERETDALSWALLHSLLATVSPGSDELLLLGLDLNWKHARLFARSTTQPTHFWWFGFCPVCLQVWPYPSRMSLPTIFLKFKNTTGSEKTVSK